MTKEIIPKEPEKLAQYYHNELVRLKREWQISSIGMAELLYNIREKQLYAEHPHDLNSFQEYLQLPDISIKYATAMQLCRVWEKYIVMLKMKPEELMSVDYHKLDIAAKMVNDKNVMDIVDQIKDMPRYAVREMVHGEEENNKPLKFNTSGGEKQVCPHANDFICPYASKPKAPIDITITEEPEDLPGQEKMFEVSKEEVW